MSVPTTSTSEFFEAKYRTSDDPWNFNHSDYELDRYDAVLRALEGRHFQYACEPGCSIGVLTAKLAPRCERLFAFDFSLTAVGSARTRCSNLPNVEIECQGLQDVRSFSDFDLIVLCEIGYYFRETEWCDFAARLVADLRAGSSLLAAHWTGESSDHQTSGDFVHEVLLRQEQLRLQRSERHAGFRLERWERQ